MENFKIKMMLRKVNSLELSVEAIADAKGYDIDNDAIFTYLTKEAIIFEEMIEEVEGYKNDFEALKMQYNNIVDLANKMILRINIYSK